MTFSLSKLLRTGVERKLGFVFFFLLFPGFFFYHTAIALRVIPPILGGFFSPISVVVIVALLPLVLWGMLQRGEVFHIDILFWLIIIYWFFTLLVYQYFGGSSSEAKLAVTGQSLRALLANIACYTVGRSLDFDSTRSRLILRASLAGMLVITLWYADNSFFNLRALPGNYGKVASYQGFGRSAYVVSVLILALDKRLPPTFVVIIAATLLLFVNGARSEFVFFITAAGVHVYYVILKNVKVRLASIILLVAITLGFFHYSNELASLLSQKRMAELVDIFHSPSGMERHEFMCDALKVVARNPVLGSFGAYFDIGGVGSYAHNLISAWADLGLIGFALYVIALIVLLKGGLKLISVKSKNPNTCVFIFALILTIAYVTSKDYTYMMFGFTAGLYAKALSAKNRSKKTSDSVSGELVQRRRFSRGTHAL